MDKQEFLAQLRKGLGGLPQKDMEERLSFYSEMIDDRMEEGLSETDAVAAVGSVEEITSQIIGETPLATIVKERVKGSRRLKTWQLILLVLGSPIWLSLGIAAIAVIFSVYGALWSVIISLWAVFSCMVACAFGVAAGSVALLCVGKSVPAMAMLAAGLVCAGLSIFMFFGCTAATKGVLALTKKIGFGIQKLLY